VNFIPLCVYLRMQNMVQLRIRRSIAALKLNRPYLTALRYALRLRVQVVYK